jgi:uncharacterized protein YlxW (UPF0749 family)
LCEQLLNNEWCNHRSKEGLTREEVLQKQLAPINDSVEQLNDSVRQLKDSLKQLEARKVAPDAGSVAKLVTVAIWKSEYDSTSPDGHGLLIELKDEVFTCFRQLTSLWSIVVCFAGQLLALWTSKWP